MDTSNSNSTIKGGEFIAMRTFEVRHQDGSMGIVRVEIGRPEKIDDSEGTDYQCAYRISGLGEEPRQRSAFGVDSLQALTLSIKMAAVELEAARKKYKLIWPGTEYEDLVFP